MKEKERELNCGTTGRGIGHAYVSKVARIGIRMIDLLDTNVLAKLIQNTRYKSSMKIFIKSLS